MSDYIPPLRYRFLTRFYDPLVRLTTRESAFKQALLAPKGSFHVADWGRPSNALMRRLFLTVQLLDGFETTQDSITGALPDLMRKTGFSIVEETASFATPVGTMRLFQAA